MENSYKNRLTFSHKRYIIQVTKNILNGHLEDLNVNFYSGKKN